MNIWFRGKWAAILSPYSFRASESNQSINLHNSPEETTIIHNLLNSCTPGLKCTIWHLLNVHICFFFCRCCCWKSHEMNDTPVYIYVKRQPAITSLQVRLEKWRGSQPGSKQRWQNPLSSHYKPYYITLCMWHAVVLWGVTGWTTSFLGAVTFWDNCMCVPNCQTFP